MSIPSMVRGVFASPSTFRKPASPFFGSIGKTSGCTSGLGVAAQVEVLERRRSRRGCGRAFSKFSASLAASHLAFHALNSLSFFPSRMKISFLICRR